MKAGLVTGRRRFELVDVPEPSAGPGLVVVEVGLCGICGTDVHGYLSDGPHTRALCGHEFAGTVSAVGTGVTSVHEGQRVVAGVVPACGGCEPCRAGLGAWCQAVLDGMLGRDALAPPHGGFAPRVALDARRLVPVAEGLTDEQAAMVEPATVALHAVRRTPVHLGDTVVVQGCGPIGLLTLQCARAAGAGRVVAVEPDPQRRELATTLGADAAVSPDAAPDFLRGGADVVYECAGTPDTLQRAVELARRGGIVNLVGLAAGPATIRPASWLVKEVTVVASLGYLHHEFVDCMDLIADERVQVTPLHDATIGLSELPATMERLATGDTSAVKVLVDPRR